MKSIADGLPPEIAAQVHPDWRKNEQEYWAVRDSLLPQYRDQWVAFAGGAVIASGRIPVDIFHAARRSGIHPFVICVGRESEPFRIRRAAFCYDVGYSHIPLPLLEAEFRESSGAPGLLLDRVIPDTGADVTALPWGDCQKLQLDWTIGVPSLLSGIGGSSTPTLIFPIWVSLDGQEYVIQVHADNVGSERIMGRDVLNRLEILFRGPSGEVVVNP